MKHINKSFLIILVLVILMIPILIIANTTAYDFEADTIGQVPNNVSRYNYSGGTQLYRIVDDVVLGKSLSISGDNKQDAFFDLGGSSCSSLDVSFKMNTTLPFDGIIEQNGVLIFTNINNRSGYMVQWDDNISNALRIFRRNDLSTNYSHTLLATGSGFPTTTDNKWRVSAVETNGTVTITAYSWNGSSWVPELSTTDTAHTSGGFGVTRPTSATQAPMIIDDIIIDDGGLGCVPSSENITITNLSRYQMFQRKATNDYDIPVSGTYSGICTEVEARWNSGSYVSIDASPSGGTFSGTLFNQSSGQGSLDVRCSNDINLNDSVEDIGIGDVFVVAGQSNAQGRASSAQTYSHPSIKAVAFNENDEWIEANDPIDIETNLGSPWPLVATYILADQAVPVGFITTAKGGTALVSPPEWAPPNGIWYVNMLQQVSDSGIDDFKAILWHQGENDINNSVSRSAYNAGLDALAAQIQTDVPGAPPLIVAQVGYKTTSSPSRDDIDWVRMAQSDAWDDNPIIFAGPSLYDIGPLSDGVHFQTSAQIEALADRWWAAIDEAIYDGTKGRGPKFNSAVENIARDEIEVSFSNVETTLLPSAGISGFRVEDNGSAVAISGVNRIDTDTVLITLSSPLIGVATVSLGSGNDQGNLTDSSIFNLPAESFIEEPTSLPDTTPPTVPASAPDLQAASDSGLYDTDNITSDTTPSFDVMCTESDSVINLYSNNPSAETLIGTVSCSGVGIISISVFPAINEGTHSITYTEEDFSGNESLGSASLSIVIDENALPPICLTNPASAEGDTGITTVCSGVETDAIVTIPNMSCSAESGGSVSCSGVSGTGSGRVMISNDIITMTDLAGNIDDSETTNFIFLPTAALPSDSTNKRTSIRYSCGDITALNYNQFGRHDGSLCLYENSSSIAQDQDKNKCYQNALLTQNLKAPSRDGIYSPYTQKVVTEAKILQRHLNRLGFNSGIEDGILGPITDGAIKRMQLFLKVAPDGYVGPITRAAINSSCQ